MLRSVNSKNRPVTRDLPKLLAPCVASMGLFLAGCSADFLRFDAPAFSLNGGADVVETRNLADASAGSLGDARETRPLGRPYQQTSLETAGTPVAETDATRRDYQRSAPPTARYETSAAIDPPASDRVTPVATGALPAADGAITVESGDTLYQISRRYGVSVEALRRANGLTGNVIRPGQQLVLPGSAGGTGSERTVANVRPQKVALPPERTTRDRRNDVSSPRQVTMAGSVYTVRPGDSLYAISRRTGVSVDELKRRNAITNVRALKPGMQLSLGAESEPRQEPAQTRVASRVDYGAQPLIKAKPIRTVPITRRQSEPAAVTATPRQPRILNERPASPIATKPKQEVAMAAPAAGDQKFRWPARGRIIAPFNHSGNGVKNDGINIALPVGTDIAAVGAGVVAYAGSELKGYGNLVLVRHDNGWVSAYAHASEVLVKRGDRIAPGQIIAKAGRTGDVTQPQLHFELRKGAKPVDPIPHLQAI